LALIAPSAVRVGDPIAMDMQLRNDGVAEADIVHLTALHVAFVVRDQRGDKLKTEPDYVDSPKGGSGPLGGDGIDSGRVTITKVQLRHIVTLSSRGTHSVTAIAHVGSLIGNLSAEIGNGLLDARSRLSAVGSRGHRW